MTFYAIYEDLYVNVSQRLKGKITMLGEILAAKAS